MSQTGSEAPITLFFVDLSSSRIGAAKPRASTEDDLRHAAEVVARCIENHGGRQIPSGGQGHMGMFTSPRRALSCAVAIQRRLERFNRQRGRQAESRIGVNTGEVIDEAEGFGEPGEVAKRITHRAKWGEILAASVVKELAGTVAGISFRDRGRVHLEDLPGRWHLYEVVWRAKDLPPLPVLLPLERTPFVGRESDRTQLLGVLDEAAHGRGSLVLISGEAGVGKTRLAAEIAEEARRQGLLTLIGQCYEMEEWVAPYVPVIHILEATKQMLPASSFRRILGDEAGQIAKIMPEIRELFPDIPEPMQLPPEQDRRHLFNSVCEVLERAAEVQPLLLIVDDLQWADESSLLLLERLAESLHDIPVLILGIYRDDELDLSRPLAKTLRELLRRRLAHRLALTPLTRAEAEAMIEALAHQPPVPAVVEAIFSVTEGNPFFLEEVVKHVSETGKLLDAEGRWRSDLEVHELDVPESIRLVAETRLQRLSEQGRRILTIAAVIGRDFSVELLEELSEAEPDDLVGVIDDAIAANLIVPAPSERQIRFAFAHQLIRQTLAGGLSLPRRQQLHAAIAKAMEQIFVESLDDHAVDLAHHLYLAGAAAEAHKVRHFLRLAGDRALAVAAFGEALGHYRRALSLPGGERDEDSRLSLRFQEGLARARLGDLEGAIDCWREALDGYEQLGAAEEVGRLCRVMALQLSWSGRLQEGLQMARRGLAALGDRASVDRGRLQCMAGRVLTGAGEHRAANAMIREGLALAEGLHDRQLQADGLVAKTQLHYFCMQFVEAVDVGLEVAELLREMRAPWALAEVLCVVDSSLWQLGRSGEAARIREEFQPLAVRFGNVGATVLARRHEALSEFGRTASLEGLERFARDDMDLCTGGAALLLPQSYVYLGRAMFWQGRWAEALVQFQQGQRLPSTPALAGFNWAQLFLQRTYSGARDLALTMLEESRHEMPRAGQPNTWGSWTMALAAAEGLAVLGERDRAAALHPLVLEVIEAGVVFRHDRRLVQTVAGLAATAGGQWEAAEDHFRKALAQAEQLPQRIEQPEVRRFHAAMLIARDGPGDRRRAGVLLREAIRDYHAIGAPNHEQMAKSTLARLRSRASGSQRAKADRAAKAGEHDTVFRKEGEYWTIGYEGRICRLKDTAGLRYLALLLRNPGGETHVMDLVAEVHGRPAVPNAPSDTTKQLDDLGVRAGPHYAAEILDPQAQTAFKRRMADLLEDLQEAEEWHDPERASRAREEIDALRQALAQGRGMAGRDRRSTTTAERARVAVTKAIRAAVKKIAENHPELGHHLDSTIKTGTFCSYAPDSSSRVGWRF